MIDKEYIDQIVEAQPLRIVVSCPKSKENEILKVKYSLKSSTGKVEYQIEKFTKKQVFHENIGEDSLGQSLEEVMEDYKQLSAESNDYSIDLRLSKKGKVFFSKKSQKNHIKINTSHNKKKNYILEEGMDIPALKDLGVFTKDGKVVNSRYDKYKQINSFVELIDHEIKNISEDYQK